MKKKLELKHLAPYLPYNLKCIRVFNYEGKDNIFIEEVDTSNFTAMFNDSRKKPVLRPLSDLTEGFIHGFYSGGKSSGCLSTLTNIVNNKIHVDITKEYGYGDSVIGLSIENILSFDYEFVSYLFENHFDVFELIDKGLAVDINTLK